ncbi:putative syntaxin 6 [Helianthus annuus]|nr:putative syntaxin 6 [Helianthus annuus]
MLVANAFDLWQKDIFFSAAEEVQASADIMESAYRTWVRQKKEGVKSVDLDELCRELQTALGTAKWQLDEFQRAVRLSYKNSVNDVRTTRHEQFISAISSQISAVESALKEYFSDEVRKPLRWVNLDEEERDDLAMFLSGSAERSKNNAKDSSYTTSCKDVDSYVIDVEPVEIMGTSDGSSCQADKKAGSSRRTRVVQDVETLKIAVDHDDEQKPLMLNDVESTPKDKGYGWRPRCGNYWINQIFKRAAGSQRQLQTSIHLHRSCSFRVTLVLMLTIFLLVPFVMYCN